MLLELFLLIWISLCTYGLIYGPKMISLWNGEANEQISALESNRTYSGGFSFVSIDALTASTITAYEAALQQHVRAVARKKALLFNTNDPVSIMESTNPPTTTAANIKYSTRSTTARPSVSQKTRSIANTHCSNIVSPRSTFDGTRDDHSNGVLNQAAASARSSIVGSEVDLIVNSNPITMARKTYLPRKLSDTSQNLTMLPIRTRDTSDNATPLRSTFTLVEHRTAYNQTYTANSAVNEIGNTLLPNSLNDTSSQQNDNDDTASIVG